MVPGCLSSHKQPELPNLSKKKKAPIPWCKVMSCALASISGWKQPSTARISSCCHDLTKSHLCPNTPSKSIWCGSAFVQHPMIALNNPVPLTGRFQQENILTKGADTAPLCLMKTRFQLWGKEGSLHPGALYCQKQQIAKNHCEELGIESPELINPSFLFTWHSLSSQRENPSATSLTSSLQSLEGQNQAWRRHSHSGDCLVFTAGSTEPSLALRAAWFKGRSHFQRRISHQTFPTYLVGSH